MKNYAVIGQDLGVLIAERGGYHEFWEYEACYPIKGTCSVLWTS